MTLTRARSFLEPQERHVRLLKTLMSIESTWETIGLHGRVDASTQAHVWNSLFYSTVVEQLGDDSGFRQEMNSNHQRYLMFDDEMVVRFKKVDLKLRTSNYRTRTNLLWEGQQPMFAVPNMERLNFCYQLDLTGLRVQRAFITLPRYNVTEWVWQVFGDEFETAIQGNLFNLGEPVFAFAPIAREAI